MGDMAAIQVYRFLSGWMRRVARAALCALVFSLAAAGCGPKKQETWNSYYYSPLQDNDDTYTRPIQGSWNDNQTPQGMKWK